MTDTTAALHNVTLFNRGTFSLGECRRIIRYLVGGVVVSLGAVTAGGALVATAAVAASWIVNAALVTDPHLQAKTPPPGPAAFALASDYPKLARAADFAGSARVSTASADTPTFEAEWARVTAPASLSTEPVPLAPRRSVDRASDVASLQPVQLLPPQNEATPDIARAPEPTHVAELASAMAAPAARPNTLAHPPTPAPERVDNVPLPRPHPVRDEIARLPAVRAVRQVAVVAPSPASIAAPRPAQSRSMKLPDPDSRTAIYDIAAHTVYLPNGDRLEAHSGLGNKLDDPRFVNVKDRGPTPPNVYDLTLREQLFHDVRAIRLTPVDSGRMFGRDGMLAHPYMLGASGQSFGCVSFKDYPAFLHAYLRGEVARLVVVPHLGDAPTRAASARRESGSRYADNNP